MYGQRSAPRRWEDTLAPWLESKGFVRGANEPSVFYRASDDLTVLVYVDDLLCDGDQASVEEFLTELSQRFDINEPIYLSPSQPIDFIGIIIGIQSCNTPVTCMATLGASFVEMFCKTASEKLEIKLR